KPTSNRRTSMSPTSWSTATPWSRSVTSRSPMPQARRRGPAIATSGACATASWPNCAPTWSRIRHRVRPRRRNPPSRTGSPAAVAVDPGLTRRRLPCIDPTRMRPMARDSQPRASTSDGRGRHGAVHLPGLVIDEYSLRLPDPEGEGFLGDRASRTAFRALLDTARREHLHGDDPFGKTPTAELAKDEIDLVLVGGGTDGAHAVHLAVEQYARRLCEVIRVFMAQPQWAGVERIVIGGGFPEHETGALAIRRAMRLLELADTGATLHPLRHDPDKAGLLGWAPLLPAEAHAHDAF